MAHTGIGHDSRRAARRPRRFVGEIVALETAVERAAADAEHLGGRHPVAVHLAQDVEDVLALDLVERRRRFAERARRWPAVRTRGVGAAGVSGPNAPASSRSDTSVPSDSMHARSMTFFSSRTLPSQRALSSSALGGRRQAGDRLAHPRRARRA